VLGGLARTTGIGATLGVPAIVVSSGVIAGGAANVAAGARGLFTTGSGSSAEKGTPPPNMSPAGAGRQGAFNEAKRQNNIPTSQQPASTTPNVDRRGNPQPGRQYKFRDANGNEVIIRDDAAGHNYGPDNPQNRGPHFNDPAGNHYDY
jgi:hypothetical protein